MVLGIASAVPVPVHAAQPLALVPPIPRTGVDGLHTNDPGAVVKVCRQSKRWLSCQVPDHDHPRERAFPEALGSYDKLLREG